MIKIRVSSKGQVVIPIEVRDRFGIDTGTELELREQHGYISLHVLPPDPLAAARGLLRGPNPTRSLLRDLLREKHALIARDRSRSRGAGARESDEVSSGMASAPTLFDSTPR